MRRNKQLSHLLNLNYKTSDSFSTLQLYTEINVDIQSPECIAHTQDKNNRKLIKTHNAEKFASKKKNMNTCGHHFWKIKIKSFLRY